jgi:hypothetical protein
MSAIMARYGSVDYEQEEPHREHGQHHHGERRVQPQHEQGDGRERGARQEERPAAAQARVRAVAQVADKGLDEAAGEGSLVGQQPDDLGTQAVAV